MKKNRDQEEKKSKKTGVAKICDEVKPYPVEYYPQSIQPRRICTGKNVNNV